MVLTSWSIPDSSGYKLLNDEAEEMDIEILYHCPALSTMEYIDETGSEDAKDVRLSICRTKPRRVIFQVAKKVNQRKSKFMRHRHKYYNRARLSNIEESIPLIPWHAISMFLVPILLEVMQVEYQNKKESPFDTHPVQKQTFLTAICIYGALLGIKIHTKTGNLQSRVLSYGLLFSGAFSSLSLLSILLHQQLLWIVFLIWGSIPILLARRTLKTPLCWMLKTLLKLVSKVFSVFRSKRGSSDVCPRV
ncbi:hypothetical protein CR513_32594, partial [Mucuna pruriens]